MCGIAGFLERPRESDSGEMQRNCTAMAESLRHRGPDDGDIWCDPEAGVALGHRRLAILDLSPLGRQPMISASGRMVLSYNGEIYNFLELRAELEAGGTIFRSRCDTEVLLEACERWGIAGATTRLIGMFAFALWDRKTRKLFLVRDRVGIKPLYWGRFGSILAFASELKSLRTHPAFPAEIDRNALSAYLRYGYIPAPHSIYRDVRKLQPGSILAVGPDGEPTETPFWSLADVVDAGREDMLDLSDEEAIEHLDALLRDAVARRMVADTPVGAFLSGGIDSSTVVALMQAQSSHPVRSFSIGFHEHAYNEANRATEFAKHFGTDHSCLYLDPGKIHNLIARLPTIYDEPFADSSQIPTLLVSELARGQVTVSLSGDGGDELFAGYSRYFQMQSILRHLNWPAKPGAIAAFAIRNSLPVLRQITLLPNRWRRRIDNALTWRAEVLRKPASIHRIMSSHWRDPDRLVIDANEPRTTPFDEGAPASLTDLIEQMQYLDMQTYLPDDILTKIDRASMAVSLEARVPLLDHRVIEFAWRLPMHMKVRNGQSKWLLRQVLSRYAPDHLTDQRKMGFSIPLDQWLREDLREWAEELLGENRLRTEGFLNPEPIRECWSWHLSGANHGYRIWNILMFQTWLEAERNP